MLFINDEQVNPKQFALEHGMKEEQYNRLIKKPSFKLDKSQMVDPKRRTINSPHSQKYPNSVKAEFWFTSKDGIKKKLRYAESVSPRTVGDKMIMEYKPTYITLEGEFVEFRNKPDQAVFMYFRPSNESSPFAGKEKVYSFIDPVIENAKKAANISDIERALNHAATISDTDLVVLAKGLGILRGDDYEIEHLRTSVKEFSISPATNKKYLQAIDTHDIRLDGKIINLVDKGIISLKKIGNGRQWVWSKGEREGESIGDIILNPTQNAMENLKNYMKSNLHTYMGLIQNAQEHIKASDSVKQYFEQKPINDVPAHLMEINNESHVSGASSDLSQVIYDFQSAKQYLKDNNRAAMPQKAKQLFEAVKEGHATSENINQYLVEMYKKD